MAEGMIAMGLLSLANNAEAFPDTDLHYIFNAYANDNIRSRAARVLAHRGDETLLNQYVKKYDAIQSTDIQGKNKTIMELANLQSRAAVPYLSKYLQDENDEVRLLALGALDMSANQDDLEVIKPLTHDSNPEVRRLSMEVMSNLMERGKAEPVPIDILLHPAPGTDPG
jgi:HEAT repeat protein